MGPTRIPSDAMPRKKVETEVPAAEIEVPKPKSRSRVKKPVAEPVAEPVVVPTPKTGSRRKKVVPAVEQTPEPVAEAQKSRTTRSRKVKTPEAEAAPVVAVEPVAEPPKAKRPVRRTPKKKAEPENSTFAPLDFLTPIDGQDIPPVYFRPRTKPQISIPVSTHEPEPAEEEIAEQLEPDLTLFEDQDFPVAVWRSKSGGQSGSAETTLEATDEEESAAAGPNTSPRRNKKRRRGQGKEPRAEATVEAAAEPAPVQPKPVVAASPVVTKPPISVPAHAPQVVVREGIPTLVRNHTVYPPIMFFGSPADERRAATVLDEVRMASEAGVHLYSFLVELDVDVEAANNSASVASYVLARTLEIDPQAQVIFRVSFIAPRNWEDRYPAARYRNAHGEIAEPSVCDDEYWEVATKSLEVFVKKLRLLPSRDSIMGVHLERGEWFIAHSAGYDTSKAAQLKFREWARRRYLDDEVTLRASWFDGSVRFDNIQIPEHQPEGGEGEKFIRSSRKQRRYVDYHLCLSDVTVERITDLAYVVKSASEGMFLVGVSYGYTFEWSHPSNGHLGLGKLLRSQEVDFIAGPPSYRSREPGGSAPFPGPIDSFALNGKLYISEEDFKTSLSSGHETDDFNPAMKSPQALESVHWRGAGAALAHGGGVAWMDLWGNGWLRTASVWDRASRVRQALTERMIAPMGEPDVAIFIDERALAYLVDPNAFQLLVQNVREAVLRAGVNAAFYLLSDLAHRERFPESKLYIFLNAWDIRPDLRAAIKSRLQRDNKVLFWLYSAGLFDAGRDSLERAREVTGIALKPQPFYSKAGTTILNRRHPLSEAFPDRSLIGGTKLEPSYFAIPENATVLGEYTQTGLPSFVVRDFNEDPQARWTSVFLGEPLVNAALIRAMAQMAGAHVWNFHEDVVHVRPPFCTVHCSGTGPRTITLPNKYSAYDLISGEWAAIDTTNLRFTAMDGSTHVFLVGPKTEIEHYLNANPDDVLRIDELPPRELNVRTDSYNFDVPIMKLDEWMENGDEDAVADEWFLRPAQVLDEPEPAQAEESPERVGRRRRRRKGRDRNDRSHGESAPTVDFSPPEPADFGDLGMNVLFRKRD